MTEDAELAVLVAKSEKIAGETDRLMEEAEAQAKAIAAWRDENGITGEVIEKLNQALTPELRERLEKEMEEAAIVDRHDLEREVELGQAASKPAKARAKRARNYI